MSTTPAPPPASLWRHLWSWTLVAMVITWATLAGVAYYTGLHEADEISDGQLEATARLWLGLSTLPPAGEPASHVGLKPEKHGYEQPQALMVWEGSQLMLDTHGLANEWPVSAAAGYHTHTVTIQGQTRHWRQYTAIDTARQPARRVTVVMDLDARNALGRDIAEHIARPALVVLPLVALLLAWALRKGLAPLNQLSTDIQALDLAHHQRLDGQHRFDDFSSTVSAINALMDKLDAQVQQERAFASDIAHELRTPLTAISLQAHVLIGTDDPVASRTAALSLREQALHAGDILAQLLAFARAQRQGEGDLQPVCLAEVLRRVVAQHAQRADETGHELALELPADADRWRLPGRPLLLELAVRNLVDNALKHTPAGTLVEVSLGHTEDTWVLAVRDQPDPTQPPSSTSVPPSTGLGLGLTLVLRIATWHGARLEIGTAPPPWQHSHALVWPAQALRLA